MTELRLLGPVEIHHEGEVLYINRRQQRIVLGILALEVNRVVPAQRLIDLLWEERPPRDARAVAQTRISELRSTLHRFLGPGAALGIEGRGGGYLMAGSPDVVDAHRFTALLDRARLPAPGQDARELLRAGLALWRGPALGGDLESRASERLCAGLDSARLAARETLLRLELEQGNHLAVVDEVVQLAAAHPTREKLVRLAMLALQRSGRPGEALREYDRWRRWLRDELGIDPGRETQELYLAVLRADTDVQAHGDQVVLARPPVPERAAGAVASTVAVPPFGAAAPQPAPTDPATAPRPPTSPRTVPPDIADFTGRSAEIDFVREALVGTGGAVVLSGAGGVGKTTLAVHLAHLLREDFPDGQLMVDLRGFDAQQPVSVGDMLTRMLRAFGMDQAALPHAIDDRVDLYRMYTAERRVLVVLDNAASDDQIRQLIPAGTGCGTIITSRARLGGTLGAKVAELHPMPPGDALRLLAAIAGEHRVRHEPAAAAELCARCGHLALAVRVVAARLQTKPHWSLSAMVSLLSDERRRLDALALGQLDIRASISLSYKDLSEPARRLLRALGDLGVAEVTAWLAGALLDIPTPRAAALLEQLFDVRLLDSAVGDAAGQLRFRMHDLVRLYSAELVGPDDLAASAAARGRAYRAWLTLADQALAALVGGAYRNIRGGTRRRPVDEATLAAVAADPVQWFELERATIATVVRRCAEDGAVAECWELTCTLSPLFELCRYYDDWMALLERGLGSTRRAGDRLGEAAMLYRIGIALADQTDNAGALSHFEQAAVLFRQVGDAHGEATSMMFVATIERFLGAHDAALRHYQECLPALSESDDRGGEAQALRGVGQVYLDRGALDEADSYLLRSIQLCRSAGWSQGEAQSLFWYGMLEVRRRAFDDAELRFRAAQEISRATGDRSGEAQTMRGLALCFRARGEIADARAILGQALDLVRQAGPTLLETHIRRALAELDAAPGSGGTPVDVAGRVDTTD